MKNNSGNILFIILIAVALFAALGYAVVQASRSNGTSTVKETSTINAAVLGQYVSSLRASLQRLTTDNMDLTTFEFNPPADFTNLTSKEVGVFHPNGGGVIYEMAPTALVDPQSSNPAGQWVFTMNFEVKDIGTNGIGSLNGNDLIAFMVGVKKVVCEQVNTKLGIPINPIPKITNQQI